MELLISLVAVLVAIAIYRKIEFTPEKQWIKWAIIAICAVVALGVPVGVLGLI